MIRGRLANWAAAVLLGSFGGAAASLLLVGAARELLGGDGVAPASALLAVGYIGWFVVSALISAFWLRRMGRPR